MKRGNERADVVIVGGGAIGASTAFHLTQRGITDIVLLERDTLGSGSTGKSAGGFRLQYADELNLRIALRSVPELESFEDMIAEFVDYAPPIDLQQHGYLFMLDNERDLATFRAAVDLQHEFDIPTVWLTAADVAERFPQVRTDDILGATFNPRDGKVTPEAVAQGYAAAAAVCGARVQQSTTVTGIATRDGVIVAVDTTKGRIATDTVICTAGAWSPEIGRFVGLDIPVRPEARHCFFCPSSGGFPTETPNIIDFSTGFYFHREGPGLLVGGREPSVADLAPVAVGRVPVIEDLPVQSSWWGYYEMSPDHNAIVGEAHDVSRFLYATGFSGHGFQQSPAIGEQLAQRVAGEATTLDLSPLSLERFAAGNQRAEHFVV
jgi:sarcosine oxidase subunit beta